jgi:hypothetical protein
MRYHFQHFIAILSISSPHAHVEAGEPKEGEAMEAVNDDDEAMMAMMKPTDFGSTKILCYPFFRLS